MALPERPRRRLNGHFETRDGAHEDEFEHLARAQPFAGGLDASGAREGLAEGGHVLFGGGGMRHAKVRNTDDGLASVPSIDWVLSSRNGSAISIQMRVQMLTLG